MKFVRLSNQPLICGAALCVLACGSDAPAPGGGNHPAGGSSSANTGGAASNSGGQPPGSGGSASTTTSSGGSALGTTGGSSPVIGSGGSGPVGTGGMQSANGGSSSVGPSSGGSSSGGGSSSSSGGCTRDFLKSTIDAYFTALAAHSASGLPLADGVKVTENGKAIMIGVDGLWKTAGTVKYHKSALDTDGCNTATEAVVPESTTDLPVALRLKFVAQKITEIETIAVRAGDYKVSGSNYPSKPDAIIMSDTTVMWETPVPAAMRNTPVEMNAWMSKYFKAFPAGVCNTDTSCKRLENGNSPGGCNLGASCQAGDPTGNVLKSHAIFSDVETGIGVGWDLFMGNTDMHMFKMYGGKVYAVHAILGTAASTGWDDK